MIISKDIEKTFDKIQHPLIMKSLTKESIEEKFLNLKCHWLPVQEWQSRRCALIFSCKSTKIATSC